MAYTMLAELPPVYGLYTSMFTPVVYFLFGTSRHVSVGTTALAGLMIGQVVREGVSSWDPTRQPSSDPLLANASEILPNVTDSSADEALLNTKVAYAMSASFASGLIQVVLGVARAGRVASFMSDALISGFLMAVSLHVLISQLYSIFGLPYLQHFGVFKLFYECRDFFLQLRHVQWTSVVTSLVSVVVLVVVKEGVNNNKKHFPRLPAPIPVELFVIILGTVVSQHFGFAKNYDMKVTGPIPTGVPSVDVSVLRFVPQTVTKVFTLALILFTSSYAIAQFLARKQSYPIDANQELLAQGMANVLGPLISCVGCSVTLSRSVVQEEVGGRTQIASLVSSLVVLFCVLFIGPLFQSLPNCVLAAIVIVTFMRIFLEFTRLPRFWRISKMDFAVWVVVFGGTVVLDLVSGLLVGFTFSLLIVLFKTQTPYYCSLGQIGGTEIYADVKGHLQAQEVPGVKIFRFEGSLYFGNVDHFRNCLEAETGLCVKDLKRAQTEPEDHEQRDETPSLRNSLLARPRMDYLALEEINGSSSSSSFPLYSPEVKTIVVDGSPMQTVDSQTLSVVEQIITDYKEVGINVFLAECKPMVSAKLQTSGFYDLLGRDHVFDTIHQAVSHALQRSPSPSTKSSCSD